MRLEVGDVIVLPGGSPHVTCCDVRPFNPLLAALPRTMVVSDRSGADGWLGQFMRLAIAEAYCSI